MADTHPPIQMIESIPNYIEEDRVLDLLSKLEMIVISLHEDPTLLGPAYIHEKLYECRQASNEVETLLLQYYSVERRVKNNLAALQELYRGMRVEYMALNDWVSKPRSVGDREARVDYLLKNHLEGIANLKEQYVNISYVLKVLELKRDSLNRANNDIKKQTQLIITVNPTSSTGSEENNPMTELFNETYKKKSKFTVDPESVDLSTLLQGTDTEPPETIDKSIIFNYDQNPEHPSIDTTLQEGETADDILNSLQSSLKGMLDLPVVKKHDSNKRYASYAIDDEVIDFDKILG